MGNACISEIYDNEFIDNNEYISKNKQEIYELKEYIREVLLIKEKEKCEKIERLQIIINKQKEYIINLESKINILNDNISNLEIIQKI
jgi:hypothetical protein